VQALRLAHYDLRARASIALLAASAPDRERAKLRAEAERAIRALDRERMPLADGIARLLRASLANVDGDRTKALAELEGAERIFTVLETALLATIARRHRGALLETDVSTPSTKEEGAKIRAEADAWLASQGARDPAKLCALYAPGFTNAITGSTRAE
jgi:hypothetical protein